MQRILCFFAIVVAHVLSAQPVHAIDQGRLIGLAVDDGGAPLAGVKVVVTSPDIRTFHLEKVSDTRGEFTIIVVDATRAYSMRMEKEGYAPLEEPLPLKVEETVKQTFTLHKATPAAPATSLQGVPPSAPASQAAPAASPEASATKNEAVLAFNAGVSALNAKDIPGATADFEKAARLDPTLAPAQLALGEIYSQQGKNADALAALDRYAALQPGDVRGLRARYDVLKAMADPRAAEALDALVAADHSHDTAVRVFNHAADSLRAGNMDLGIKELNRALQVDPNLTPAYSGLASLYLSQRRYQDALDLADHWLEHAPGKAEPLTARYQALVGLKDPRAKEARTAAQAAAGNAANPALAAPPPPAAVAPPAESAAPAPPPAPPTPETLYNRGITLYNSGKLDQATPVFEEVVRTKPELARAHYMLALCYVNAGQGGKARDQLKEFIRLAPNAPEAGSARDMLRSVH